MDDYNRKIVQLSGNTVLTKVGGAMWPIGETREQPLVADWMRIFTGNRRRQRSKSRLPGKSLDRLLERSFAKRTFTLSIGMIGGTLKFVNIQI